MRNDDHNTDSPSNLPWQKTIGLFLRYLKPQWRNGLLMALLLLTAIALQLTNPQVIRYFLDTAQSGGALRALLIAALLFITFALLQRAMELIASTISQRVGWKATNHLRNDLMLHCLRLDMTFHKQHPPGELIERIDGDVSLLANFFSQFFVRVLGNGLLLLGILILLFRENLWIGMGMLFYTAATLFLLNLIQQLAVPRWRAERQANAEQYAYLEERIAGVEDIRSVGAEDSAMRGLYQLMRNFLHKNRAANVTSSLAYNLTNLLYAIGYTVGLAVGVYLYFHGKTSLGTVYLLTYYIGMLNEPLQAIRQQVQDFQQSTASIQRIQQLFLQKPAVKDVATNSPESVPHLPGGALAVGLQEVSFHYEDNEIVLHDINLILPPGHILGILGRTGSGKSTLGRLLFRLYDPDSGRILLGGVDIRCVPLAELRRRIGMVTQDVQLFHATIRDNLTFFNPNISDAHLESVLTDLKLWAWVKSVTGGLDAHLGSGSQGLSAGEAQLLAFGRVFLNDPGLVILDEASSRLDPATETLMEHAVDRLFSGRTAIIIAHRLRTLERADAILILEEGRVVEYGARLALANDSNSRYHQLLRIGLEEVLG
jgi:ATP-binding cassette subfamily B protein